MKNEVVNTQNGDYSALEQSVVEATQTYLDAWTFEAPVSWEPFRSVFMAGEDEILVVDNFGNDVTVLNSVDSYIETWEPVVASVWQSLNTTAEDLTIFAEEELAVSTFILVANGEKVDGSSGSLKQRATLVWRRNDNNDWRVVREHLTTLPSSNL